jgi:hypothetical protein
MAVDSLSTMHGFTDTGYPRKEHEQPSDYNTRDASIFYEPVVMKGMILGYEEYYGELVTSRDQWLEGLGDQKPLRDQKRRRENGGGRQVQNEQQRYVIAAARSCQCVPSFDVALHLFFIFFQGPIEFPTTSAMGPRVGVTYIPVSSRT